MILYHGTAISRFEDIKINGLRINSPSMWKNPENQGTKGYIYLTANVALAAYFANGLASQNEEQEYVVFEVEYDENELEKDEDEMKLSKYKNRYDIEKWDVRDCLQHTSCCRVSSDIPVFNLRRYIKFTVNGEIELFEYAKFLSPEGLERGIERSQEIVQDSWSELSND